MIEGRGRREQGDHCDLDDRKPKNTSGMHKPAQGWSQTRCYNLSGKVEVSVLP
jgi:hypothetical protein